MAVVGTIETVMQQLYQSAEERPPIPQIESYTREEIESSGFLQEIYLTNPYNYVEWLINVAARVSVRINLIDESVFMIKLENNLHKVKFTYAYNVEHTGITTRILNTLSGSRVKYLEYYAFYYYYDPDILDLYRFLFAGIDEPAALSNIEIYTPYGRIRFYPADTLFVHYIIDQRSLISRNRRAYYQTTDIALARHMEANDMNALLAQVTAILNTVRFINPHAASLTYWMSLAEFLTPIRF